MRIPALFGNGRPVFSFEFFLPKTEEDMAAFKETARQLKSLHPSFVTMTYGAMGTARERSIDAAGMLQREMGIPTAAHLTCVSHTRADILEILKRIRSHGIDTIVALRGDAPKDGSGLPLEKRELKFACDLVALIKSVGGFSMAVAGYPEGHPENPSKDADLMNLKAKIDAGGDWVITQLFFDNARYFDFVKRARALGIDKPIVPGIMPVANAAQLQRFTQMCGASIPAEMARDLERIKDDKEAVVRYGIDYAAKQCRELLQGGAPGIHFYTLNRSRSTATVLERLRGNG